MVNTEKRCPNLNSKEWKYLVENTSSQFAWRTFIYSDETLLPLSLLEDIVEKYKKHPVADKDKFTLSFNEAIEEFKNKYHIKPSYSSISKINEILNSARKNSKYSQIQFGIKTLKGGTFEITYTNVPDVSNTLFQTESKGTVNEALNNVMKVFLSKAKFNVEEVFDEIITRTGDNVAASVDLFNRLIKIAKNKEGEDTLTEEAVHVFTAMLGPEHPLYIKMMALVEQTETWENTYQQYNDIYEGNMAKIKKEAMDKMITKLFIQKFKQNETNTTSKTVWDKFVKLVEASLTWLSNKFKNIPDTFESEVAKVYGEAADMLLKGKIPKGNIKLSDTFYQQLNKIKSGIKNLFEANSTLSSIGSQEQYSQYLEQIYPNSPNKKILYHIGGKDIQQFDKNMFGKGEGTNASGLGVYFQEDPYEIMNGGLGNDYFYESPTPIKSMLEDGVLTLAVVDIKAEDKYNKNLKVPQEIVIRDVNRIHILGSKQDIQGFKDFVNSQTFYQLDSDKKKKGDFIVNQGFPMQTSNLEKIQFGEKRLTVRPNDYKEGVYKFGDYFYQVRKIKQNKALYSEFKSGNFLKEKAFGTEEIKYQHIQDFFDNKTPMYVYSIMKLDSNIQMLYKEETKKKKAEYKDAIQEQIERSEVKITRIKRKPGYLNSATDLAAVSKLEEYIKQLTEERLLSLIEIKATNELNAIEQRLNDNFEEMAEKKGFFTYALETLKGWQDLNQFIKYPEDKEGKQRIINLVGKAKDLEDLLWEKYKEFGSKEFGEDFNSSITDESYFGANFLDIAQSKIPILKKIGEFISKARYVAYQLTSNLNKEIDEEFTKLKQWSGYTSDKELWDLFRQKDTKGNWTGHYVAEISNAFYEKKAELAKWAKENKSWKAYYRWLNANTDKIFNKEAYEAMYEQVKREEFTQPDGIVDEAGLAAWAEKNGENGDGGPFIKYNPKVELWKDKRYEYIQSTPELKRFYDFFIDKLQERMSVLPEYERNQTNYLPELRRNALFDLSKGGMTGLMSGWLNQFKDSFATDIESSKETVLRDPITKEPEKTIPVYMMGDRMNPNDKEYDLTKVLKSFGAMSYLYEQKNAIEEPVKLMSSLFRQLKEKLVAEGIDKTDRNNKLVEILDGNKQSVDMMEYYIDAMVYDKIRAEDTTKKLGEVVTGKETKIVDGEEVEVDVVKKITVGSIADWLINYTRFKGLSLNIFSAVTNSIFGPSSTFIHAEGKTDFTPKQAMDAYGLVLNSLIKNTDTNKKVNFFMEKFRIKPEYVAAEGNKLGKYAFALTEASEHINYGQSGIATILNTKVKDKKGEEKSLYDAYIIKDGKVVWNEAEFGPEQYNDLSEEKYDLYSKIAGINKRIHGNYDTESPIKVKSHVWGRAVMIFRSWLPMAIYTRFGSQNMSKELGREVKGRYISGWEYGKQNTFKAILPIFKELMTQVINMSTLNRLELESGAFDELSEIDKENMLRNVAELRYILFFMLLGSVMRGIELDDEDEEKVSLTNFIINQTDRVEGELSFFFSPYDQSRIIRDISPVSRTFTDFYDLVPATTRLLSGDDELKRGSNKGKSNFYRQLKQAVPLISQVQKVEELADLNVNNPMYR